MTEEERNLFNYKSLVTDWPDEGREQAVERISQGELAHQILVFCCIAAVIAVLLNYFLQGPSWKGNISRPPLAVNNVIIYKNCTCMPVPWGRTRLAPHNLRNAVS